MVRIGALKQQLDLFQVTSEPYEIGLQSGELARPAFVVYMNQSRAPAEYTLATALSESGGAGVSMKVCRLGQCAFDRFVACNAVGQTRGTSIA